MVQIKPRISFVLPSVISVKHINDEEILHVCYRVYSFHTFRTNGDQLDALIPQEPKGSTGVLQLLSPDLGLLVHNSYILG